VRQGAARHDPRRLAGEREERGEARGGAARLRAVPGSALKTLSGSALCEKCMRVSSATPSRTPSGLPIMRSITRFSAAYRAAAGRFRVGLGCAA